MRINESPSEAPRLHYKSGLYQCIILEKSFFDSVKTHMPIEEWFHHNPALHPPVTSVLNKDEVCIWAYKSSGGGSFFETETDTHYHLHDEDVRGNIPKYVRTGIDAFIETNGNAWSARPTEKMKRFAAGEFASANPMRMNPKELIVEPDGLWESNLSITTLDPEVKTAALDKVHSQVAQAEQLVTSTEDALRTAKENLEFVRTIATKRIEALMALKT